MSRIIYLSESVV